MIDAHNLVDLDDISLQKAIKNDFDLDVTILEKNTNGYSSQVYKATLGDKIIFIRINQDPNIYTAEEYVYKLFEEKGIPAPKVIAYDPNPPSIGYPTILLTCAVGLTPKEAHLSNAEEDAVYEHLGMLVKKINETKLQGYGRLRVENNALVGEFSTWRQYVESQNVRNYKALAFCLQQKFVTEEEAVKIKEIYEEIPLIFTDKGSLLHRDIHRGHFFVTGLKVTGIIDLGAIMSGDPLLDVAYAFVFQNNDQQEHFKKGYDDPLVDDPIVNKYMIMFFIRKLYFRSKQERQGNVDILLQPLKNSLEKLH